MTLFDELRWRGFLNQTTHEELGEFLQKESFTLYCGFDPTADSLHIGSLLPIMGLMHFQRHGHKPIAVVGGGTGLIGDPSGKVQERQLLTKEQVEINAQGIRQQLGRFLDFDGPHAAIMVNNADWLCQLSLVDFLRDIGKHFSINVMLSKDSVRRRVEETDSGMSFTEFAYSLLQAFDYLYLSDHHGCRIQVGGSDQWGNIVAGMDLIRRLREKAAYGVTFPLVTKSDGTKFGKSESGNVWLDSRRTSPYKFYQFWINQADADVIRWMKFFTFLSQEEISKYECLIQGAPEKREAQKRLAAEVTRLVHGEEALAAAIRASEALFGGSLQGLDDEALEEVFSEMPCSEMPYSVLFAERLLVDVLLEQGVFQSKGEAKRLIQNNGLYLNNDRVDSEGHKLSEASLCSSHAAVLRKGKKNYHLLKFLP